MTPTAVVFVMTMYSVGCDVEKHSLTKMGTPPIHGWTIAADPRVLPMNSIIRIVGVGDYLVHDVGGKVKGHHIDMFVDSCEVAKLWGRRHIKVKVLYRGRSRP